MNIVTPIDQYTGYGISGYNIFNSLYEIDPDLALFFVAPPNIESLWNKHNIQNSVDRAYHFNPEAPCFKLWFASELFLRTAGKSKYGALSFFEIDTVPEKDLAGYNLLDIIFTPTSWAKSILEKYKVNKPIVVCPQGVDTNIFSPAVPPDKKDTYIFINIGKWEIRKGHDQLVHMFNNAFEPEDDVELWMVNSNPFLSAEAEKGWHKLYQNSKLGDKIRILPRIENQKLLSSVISYTDCGIFPARAEGWNNGAMEVMAMDKPIIITDYSAHTQYCNTDNAYLIDIPETEPAKDNIWFNGVGNWAKFDSRTIDQAVEHMRYVYKNQIRSNAKGLETANNHSWTKTAQIIYDNMMN